MFFHKKENSSINLKKTFTSTKKYIVTSFDKMTFEDFAKNFVVKFMFEIFAKKFAKIFDVSKIINIIRSMKNYCKLNIYMINIIDNITSNNANDEIIIITI